ncbi:hypothetical protein IW138_002143 [Coemansia sp. RSA 986]|nr:hypothetical protein LPJ74_003843 [Coemansia sp. RSA 1843]KAJ2091180.1 hypothetical protein IW138_002143 [Coemansia sp. RSA 986]
MCRCAVSSYHHRNDNRPGLPQPQPHSSETSKNHTRSFCLGYIDGNEEAAVATHDAPAAAQTSTIDDETQPLLSESAIRTRYADNANEFARSFIEQPNYVGHQVSESLTQSGGLSFDPAENAVAVVQSDSSDSGIESTASGSESSASESSGSGDEEEDYVRKNRESLAVSPCDGISGESCSLAEPGDSENDTKNRVEPNNEDTNAETDGYSDRHIDESEPVSEAVPSPHVPSRTPNGTAVHDLGAPSVERRDRSATTCSNGIGRNKNSDATSAPASAIGRPRSSTLNVQAKAFVPTMRMQQTAASLNPSKYANVSSGQGPAGDGNGTNATVEDSRLTGGASQAQDTPDEPSGGQTTATTVANRRCRFWPSCSNKNCKYTHPSQTCRMHPNCAFGTSCIYIHPSDMNKINAVVTRGNGRRSKRKNNELIRYNNLEAFVT